MWYYIILESNYSISVMNPKSVFQLCVYLPLLSGCRSHFPKRSSQHAIGPFVGVWIKQAVQLGHSNWLRINDFVVGSMVIQVSSGSILTETAVESSSMKASQKYIIDFITFFLRKYYIGLTYVVSWDFFLSFNWSSARQVSVSANIL